MAKRPDDNLEKFFLNRVDDYKIDYREGDWQNLNEMLDAAAVMKAAALKQKIVWIGSGALLMISIVLLLWMSQNLTSLGTADNNVTMDPGLIENIQTESDADKLGVMDNPQVKDESTVDQSVRSNQVIVGIEDIENSSENSNTNQASIQPLTVKKEASQEMDTYVPGEKDGQETQSEENQASIQPLVAKKDTEQEKINNILNEKDVQEPEAIISDDLKSKDNNPIDDGINDTIGKESASFKYTDTTSQVINEDITKTEEKLETDHISGNRVTHKSTELAVSPVNRLYRHNLNIALGDTKGITFSPDSRNEPTGLELRKNYAWNISVAADNSAVGMSDFDGPSLRLGLALEFFLSKRVSFVAGLNYSAKNYTAYGREYTPTYGFWTNGVVPDQTLGECNVLDIPANLTYYIPNGRGQAVFLRAGLSSWLMLEEHYYFSYESNDPNLIKYWGGENENHHYLSIVNLSVGFEHELSHKFSVLAEPYLNIPMGGVGFGKVHLYSAGIKFTMKINHFKLMQIP